MARPLRIEGAGFRYHVICRGNARQRVESGSGVDLRHLRSGVRRETATLIQLRGITNWTGATVHLALAHEYNAAQQLTRISKSATRYTDFNYDGRDQHELRARISSGSLTEPSDRDQSIKTPARWSSCVREAAHSEIAAAISYACPYLADSDGDELLARISSCSLRSEASVGRAS